MIKKVTEKLKAEKQVYNFKLTPSIAGMCPDCNSFIHFNSYHQRFECSGNTVLLWQTLKVKEFGIIKNEMKI